MRDSVREKKRGKLFGRSGVIARERVAYYPARCKPCRLSGFNYFSSVFFKTRAKKIYLRGFSGTVKSLKNYKPTSCRTVFRFHAHIILKQSLRDV